MNISLDSREVVETQTVHVQAALDVGVWPIPYSRAGRYWRPDRVSVTWERQRVNGGDWGDWKVDRGMIIGPRVNRDGADSVQLYSERIYGWPGPAERVRSAELREWIEDSRPDPESLPVPVSG